MSRILIVDDKEENLYFLEVLLKNYGYEVVSARHGVEAMVKAWQSKPAMVISDLLMPVMDGYTLLRKWKVDAILRHIPFIVYTATYLEPEDAQLAIGLGADAFILKSEESDRFIQTLREVEQTIKTHGAPKPGASDAHERVLLKANCETLVRKLSEKNLQLAVAHQELQLDIKRRKEAEDQIQQLAFYDPLTGLPNRRLMIDHLLSCRTTSAKNQLHGALLYIDLDHMKLLNESKGHHIGDLLLNLVATRLQSCSRDGDTIARIGGDEFVIVLRNLSKNLAHAASLAERVAYKVLHLLHQPYELNNEHYLGSASIGIHMCHDQELSLDDILQRAQSAVSQAKAEGRNTFRFHDPLMQTASDIRTKLEAELQLAIQNNAFELYFQPQVSQTGEIVGAEALIRCQSLQENVTPPYDFLTLAEEAGLIIPIVYWVIKSACEHLRAWQQDLKKAHLQLSVNISARQFYQIDFVECVLKTLNDHKVHANRLKLELTESVVLEDVPAAMSKMQALKNAGLRFSLDNFGTGYSSLSHLAKLPFSELKIAQSCLHNITLQQHDVMVPTIISIADKLKLEVVAEGVENNAQLAYLKSQGCTQFQGYLFGEPMPIAQFESLLST